jgi:hypothetical protein
MPPVDTRAPRVSATRARSESHGYARRVALVLPSLAALLCGACVGSTNDPANGGGTGGPPATDTSQPDGGGPSGPVTEPGNDSAPQATLDATSQGTGNNPSGPNTTLGGDGSSAGIDAGHGSRDGSLDAGSAAVDGSLSSKDATSPIEEMSDASGRAPLKGVAGSNCPELVTLGVSWWYDWALDPTGCTSTPFVPMVWGGGTAAGITSQVSAGAAAGYKYVLGFNEPDNASQSNIPVATAISLWPSFNNPAVLIGSPATQGNATGLAWIQDFMGQVNADTTGRLRVDFIATHWYGWNAGACDPGANSLQSWIEGIEAIPGNRPIWLTEWGCLNQSNPNAATVQAFYAGALAMFAKHPRVVRYAWYQWSPYNELIDADAGTLTALGSAYANAPAYH